MATIRDGWAGARRIDSVRPSWGRKAISFLVAVLFPTCLAGCAKPIASAGHDSGTVESGSRRVQSQGPLESAQDTFDARFSLAWDIVNPRASHWSLSKNPGTLTITTTTGTFTRSRTDYENLVLAARPVARRLRPEDGRRHVHGHTQ
jgi:hypothetical protein